MTKVELLEAFDIKQIHVSGGRFNEEKLDWINHEHLKKLTEKDQQDYVISFIPERIRNLKNYNEDTIRKITPIIIERIKKGIDINEMDTNGDLDYYFIEPVYEKDNLFFKSSKIEKDKYGTLADYLEKVIKILDKVATTDFNKEKIKEVIWPYAEEVGRGDILWPIRYSLSGMDRSPDPFYLTEILGKEEVLKRINKAINLLRN